MFVLTYGSGWRETSGRKPELLTQLAPDYLQRHCVWNPLWNFHLWDTTLYGYPRFRLALVSSRYSLAGGMEVKIKQPNGTVKASTPDEVLLPLYHVPQQFQDQYALEMWRPAAWLIDSGFAGPQAMQQHGLKSIRILEPAWSEGAWIAIMNGARPLSFPRNLVDEDLIRWGIYCAHLLFDKVQKEHERLSSLPGETQWIEREDRMAASRRKDYEDAKKLLRACRPTIPGPMVTVPANVS